MKKLFVMLGCGLVVSGFACAENWQTIFADPEELSHAIYLNQDSLKTKSGMTYAQYLYVYVGSDQDAYLVDYAFRCGESQSKILAIKTYKNGQTTTEVTSDKWSRVDPKTEGAYVYKSACFPKSGNSLPPANAEKVITLTQNFLSEARKKKGISTVSYTDRWQMLHNDSEFAVYLKRDSVKRKRSTANQKSGQFLYVYGNRSNDADVMKVEFLCSEKQYRYVSKISYTGKKSETVAIKDSWNSIRSRSVLDRMHGSVCSPYDRDLIHAKDMFKLIEETKHSIRQ